MTIKEVEQISGLSRSSIRFYEKERLINPMRSESNGYRDYSETDLKNIQKIAYLRTLGITIEDIRRLENKEVSLYDILKNQQKNLEQQAAEIENARLLCERMLKSKEQLDYEKLDVEMYVTNIKAYWNKNEQVFKLDSVSFFYLWGGKLTWGILTILCFMVAVLTIPYLPDRIPIQWSEGMAVSFVDRMYIFAFPAVCIMIRFVLRPYIWQWLKNHIIDSTSVADYISNFLCFIALLVEVFIVV